MAVGPVRRVRIPESLWSDLETVALLTKSAPSTLLREFAAQGVRRALKRRLKGATAVVSLNGTIPVPTLELRGGRVTQS